MSNRQGVLVIIAAMVMGLVLVLGKLWTMQGEAPKAGDPCDPAKDTSVVVLNDGRKMICIAAQRPRILK